tara:strand:+ start:27255 stop:28406 length:1152 start_codon:yes stop_codon:yes gene_type:complete
MKYFDYCATTPLDPEVCRFIDEINNKSFGNPSSIHRFGQNAKSIIEISRRQLANAIGCKPQEIIFTGSGTEANNIVLWNLVQSEKKHVVISEIEHPSISDTLKKLSEFGVTCTAVGVETEGRINPDEITEAIQDDTGLVSVMAANNEIGTIQPLEKIGQICEEKQIPFHSDAVQALGKISVDIREMKVTTLSFSAHKLYGPKGVGALFVLDQHAMFPLVVGGGQEQGLRAGTENISGIGGFGLAVEIAEKKIEKEAVRLNGLKNDFLSDLKSKSIDYTINGHQEFCLPGVISITFPGISSDDLLMNLDCEGFAVSGGSACASGTPKPSKVLSEIGLSDEQNKQTLRISFGRFTSEKDVKELGEIITEKVDFLLEKRHKEKSIA